MPLFVVSCLDRPGSTELRAATREAHLAYVRTLTDVHAKLAGPYLSDDGAMVGSMFIVEAPDLKSVQAMNAADPYVKVGLFQSVDIRPFKVTVGGLKD